jgi:hypothetical protein
MLITQAKAMANGDEKGAIAALAIEDRGAENVRYLGRTNMEAARKEKAHAIADRKIDIVNSGSRRERRIGENLYRR